MNIVYITDAFPPLHSGGAEMIACHEAIFMAKRGHSVHVVTLAPGDSFKPHLEFYEKQGVQVHAISLSGALSKRLPIITRIFHFFLQYYNPLVLSKAVELVARIKPDIVHTHHIPYFSYAIVPRLRRLGYPIIHTFHGYQYECPRGGLYKKNGTICTKNHVACKISSLLFFYYYLHDTQIIAISKFIENRLRSLGYAAKNIHYLPNPVPWAGSTFEASPKSRQILYVGRMTKAKGIFTLLDAFRKLKTKDTCLRFVGNGPEYNAIKSEAFNIDNVYFDGWVNHEKLLALYLTSAVTVVPSLWHEVMNTVICESSSVGTPVVATSVGGNYQLIADGYSGYLVTPGDSDAIASKLDFLLNHPDQYSIMSQRAKEHMMQYSPEIHFEKLESIYGQVIG